ncbi:MAG: response regulator transcription factor [Bradyrhizobium sp.]
MIRVLLADDHGVLRDGLRRLIETDPGIRVVAAVNDGREAVEKTTETHPEVVVMDISMPGLNGIEATRSITGTSPATKVLILSMHGSTNVVRRALAAGARGFLHKESSGEEILAAIHAVAGGARYLGPGVAAVVNTASVQEGGRTRGDLTATEREIVRLVAEGKSSAEAAMLLGLSTRTVETYRSRLMAKLQLEDMAGLIRFAIRNGIVRLD